ncbi:17359_t:CDS:2, partial [Rhizophagus irregularis]
YICARPLPHFGAWNNFSPSHVAKLWNTPLHQPQPSISQYTTSETQWTMSIALESDLIENDKNADEILPNEQPNDPNSFNSKEEIDIDQKFPLAKGWALKGNQKLGRRGGKRMKKREDRLNARSMRDELLKHVEAGELEEEDILKVNTIQNWINTYTCVFKERATECDLANKFENVLNLSE